MSFLENFIWLFYIFIELFYLEFKVFAESLFQKSLAVDIILAHGCSLKILKLLKGR